MKGLILGFILLVACEVFAEEHSVLARITVYWRGEGSGERASWNGAQLREGHCGVDPKKIPYGSNIVFRDGECVAVDSGPAVISRKAARLSGRNAAEHNAIVIDRFFDTKQKAVAWAKSQPHFMTVRIQTPNPRQGAKLAVTKNPSSSPANIASTAITSWTERLNLYLSVPPSSFLQYARRKT